MRNLYLVLMAASGLSLAADGLQLPKTGGLQSLPSSSPAVQAILTPEIVTPAMRAAIGPLQVELEIIEVSHFPVPEGEITFTLDDLVAPPTATGTSRWRGFIRGDGDRRFAIWAIVRVTAECRRVVAAVSLRSGEAVQAEQVREESYTAFPFRTDASWTSAQVVGRTLLRSVRSGEPVAPPMVVEPIVVAKGSEVMVHFSSGGIVLKFPAIAERGGRQGDVISVRNESSGKIFSAKVRSAGLVVVENTR